MIVPCSKKVLVCVLDPWAEEVEASRVDDFSQ
jgi:hypothetical protein